VALVVADTGAGGRRLGACAELAEAGGGARVQFGQLVPATFLELLEGVETAC
jgi:hypothetical protein